MHRQAINRRPRKRSVSRIAFTLLIVAFSGLVAGDYPHRDWLLGASLGTVAAITLFLRVGWAIPCTIAGTYAGFVLDTHIKGGTPESQMWETIQALAVGTIVGLLVGLGIDNAGHNSEDGR